MRAEDRGSSEVAEGLGAGAAATLHDFVELFQERRFHRDAEPHQALHHGPTVAKTGAERIQSAVSVRWPSPR